MRSRVYLFSSCVFCLWVGGGDWVISWNTCSRPHKSLILEGAPCPGATNKFVFWEVWVTCFFVVCFGGSVGTRQAPNTDVWLLRWHPQFRSVLGWYRWIKAGWNWQRDGGRLPLKLRPVRDQTSQTCSRAASSPVADIGCSLVGVLDIEP